MADRLLGALPEAPVIVVNGHPVAELAERALECLLEANEDPFLWQYNGELVALRAPSFGAPSLVTVDRSTLEGLLEWCAVWVKAGKRGDREPDSVPPRVVSALFARAPWKHFPPLLGVVAAPVFDALGGIHARDGYNRAVWRYYHRVGKKVELPAEEPSIDDVNNALTLLLEDLLVDFPFVDDASRAHAIALLLTPFALELIDGPVMSPRLLPFFFLDSPAPSTGKGLLAQALVSVFDPGQVVATPATRDPEEWRKAITALLKCGGSHVVIDNLNHHLASGELAAMSTSGIWQTRLLGSNTEMVRVPNRSVWVFTGNNMSGSDEIVERALWIRMDARCERPGERSDFKQKDLASWVLKERHELIRAALTLLKFWVAKGRPLRDVWWKTYTPWAQMMGGVLDLVGIPGFLDNREQVRERADVETSGMVEFVSRWAAVHGTAPVMVGQLYRLCVDGELLLDRLGDRGEQSQRTRLGRLLRSMDSRIYEGWRIVLDGSSGGANRYRLEGTDKLPLREGE